MNIIQGCVFSRVSSSELKPTRVYAQIPVRQTKLTPCGECVGKVPESFAQVLARCSSLAQTKYMTRHNASLIELYFDGNAKLADSSPPWYSARCTCQTTLKHTEMFLFTQSTHMVDWRFVNHKEMSVVAVKMSCP